MKKIEKTIPLMVSDDYKERFIAEYWQTRIRAEKLEDLIVRISVGGVEFDPDFPFELLIEQYDVMNDYLKILKARAIIEQIELD